MGVHSEISSGLKGPKKTVSATPKKPVTKQSRYHSLVPPLPRDAKGKLIKNIPLYRPKIPKTGWLERQLGNVAEQALFPGPQLLDMVSGRMKRDSPESRELLLAAVMGGAGPRGERGMLGSADQKAALDNLLLAHKRGALEPHKSYKENLPHEFSINPKHLARGDFQGEVVDPRLGMWPDTGGNMQEWELSHMLDGPALDREQAAHLKATKKLLSASQQEQKAAWTQKFMSTKVPYQLGDRGNHTPQGDWNHAFSIRGMKPGESYTEPHLQSVFPEKLQALQGIFEAHKGFKKQLEAKSFRKMKKHIDPNWHYGYSRFGHDDIAAYPTGLLEELLRQMKGMSN